MLDGAALAAILASLPVTSITSVLYRAVTRRALVGDPPYPTVRPLFDLGAPQRGARYTPVGGMRSLYLTEDPETALAEVNQAYAKLRRQNPPIMAAIPACVVYSADVRLDAVVDLMDDAVQSALQTDMAELCDPTWRIVQNQGGLPPTQILGRAAFQTGRIQALRYPSAQMEGRARYVIFTERLTGSSFVSANDPDGYLRERLP